MLGSTMAARAATRRTLFSTRRAARRGVLIVVCALVALLGGGSPASADVARSADAFVDSIGVNTHSYYGTPAYKNYAWRAKLLASGVRHVRENLQRYNSTQIARLNDLYAAGGIRASLIFDPRTDRGGSVRELVSRLKTSLLAATAQVEGPNEYENAHKADWATVAAAARAYQAELFTSINADPATAHLPVLGPSVAYPSGYTLWGNLAGWLDQGNMHSYPGGRMPSANLSSWLTAAATTSGAKPVQATETGYHNALSTTHGHKPASERAAGIYLPRTYLEYFRRGVTRTYAYELLSQGTSTSDIEDAFGLLRNDYSDKPAMVALRNLITLLADRGAAFTPGQLDYTIDDPSARLRHLLLEKRDGTFWLALWRESSVWDVDLRRDLNPSSATVSITLADPMASAAVYRPDAGTVAVASFADPLSLTLDVGPKVTLVELRPPTTAGTAAELAGFSEDLWESLDFPPAER